jgi:thiosulfate reductase cytochrome b subunit
MKQSTKRSILRWIHIVFAIPILGYVYSPFENIPQYAGPTRYVFFPVLVLTGLSMWKGQAIGRLFSKRSADAATE